MTYEVWDALGAVEGKYQGAFEVVIDKGTLDAILPEDKEE